jgi:hypothetical protein
MDPGCWPGWLHGSVPGLVLTSSADSKKGADTIR